MGQPCRTQGLCTPFSPRGGTGLPGHTWGCLPRVPGMNGAVFVKKIGSKWLYGLHTPLPPKGGARATVSTWGPIKFYPSGYHPCLFRVPDPHGPLEQSQPSSPRPCPRSHSTLSASPAHPHPRPSWGGSLDISLPEVAVVCQFTGLTGGALCDIVGNAKGHSLHL